MSFGLIAFTNRGRALQAKAQAGAQLNFTRLAVGDGQLSGQAIADLTALIHEIKSITLNKFKVLTGGKAVVGGVLSNQDIDTGFWLREIGLFAEDPDLGEILYCYGNAGELAEYIPSPGGAEILEKQLDIVSIVGNASNVSATIDQSMVYETPSGAQEKVDAAVTAHEEKADPHEQYALDADLAALEEEVGGIADELASHKADNIKHMSYATASGTDSYTATIPEITSLVEGLSIKIKFVNANTGSSTLNINGLGAKEIRKSNGNPLSSGNIKAGQICHLVYTGSVFQLLGEGGEYGNATPADVKVGVIFGTEEGLKVGTFTSDANATAADITIGKTAYVKGQKIIGTNTKRYGIGDLVVVNDGVALEPVFTTNDLVTIIEIDDEGNFYTFNTNTKTLSKFDLSGNLIWSTAISTTYTNLFGCGVEDVDGNLYFGATNGNQTSYRQELHCVSKHNGSVKWSAGASSMLYVKLHPTNNTYVYVVCSDNIRLFNRTNGQLYKNFSNNGRTLEFDASGNAIILTGSSGNTKTLVAYDYTLTTEVGTVVLTHPCLSRASDEPQVDSSRTIIAVTAEPTSANYTLFNLLRNYKDFGVVCQYLMYTNTGLRLHYKRGRLVGDLLVLIDTSNNINIMGFGGELYLKISNADQNYNGNRMVTVSPKGRYIVYRHSDVVRIFKTAKTILI